MLEALRAGRRRVRTVWLAREQRVAPVLDEIRRQAEARHVPLHVVTPAEIEERARTRAPQGVVARADPLPIVVADALMADPAAFLVALDGVTDPQNLGAVARVAEGAGATGLLLRKHRAVHVTPAAAKAAAGAIEYLPMAVVPGIPAALGRARRAGVWAIGLDAGAPRSLFELDLADRALVLVLGAEGTGLARLTRERCDALVRIPMAGRLESLNVAAAGALACYEVARRRVTPTGA